jgi:hypothetical protein
VATDPRGDLPRRNLEVTLSTALLRLSLVQEVPAALAWSTVRSTIPPAAGAVCVAGSLGLVLVAAAWRWWSLPRQVRRYAASMLRTDRDLRVPIGANLAAFAVFAITAALLPAATLPAEFTLGAASAALLAAVISCKRHSQIVARPYPG